LQTITYKRPKLADYQAQIIDCKERFVIVEASTKSGKTAANIIWLFEQALQGKEQERRKQEFEAAIAEFKSSKSEFQTDAAGLVFGKFQEELKKYNFNEVSSKEQAKKRLEEIYKFVNFKASNSEPLDYDGTPTGINTIPVSEAAITQMNEAALKTAGMTPEKFTQLKSKYPEALNGLGIN